jgi:UDP-N-acetylglucosamine 1-carboxyvinyltransferase
MLRIGRDNVLPAGKLVIEGKKPLYGSVRVSGSKNAADSALAACLLTGEECVLENVPDIEDVRMMASILSFLGARVTNEGEGRWRIRADDINRYDAPNEIVANQRASFQVMGPLLARFGQASACSPGGDVIGSRPLDVHLAGFEALGAKVSRRGEQYLAESAHEGERLQATRVFLDYPSVTGTMNIIFAAVLARGTSTIINAAVEPEIVSVISMLNGMGAKIRGAGQSIIEIEGVDELHGVRHEIIPDRLETGTFMIAAAISRGEATLESAEPRHLDSLISKLNEAGVHIETDDGRMRVCGENRSFKAVQAQALPYPGLATDLQPFLAAFLTQAQGVSVIHERVYENRLLYIGELRKMGADVITAGQTAIVTGPTNLYGSVVRALDIRAGSALVLAGLAAEGQTEISDAYHLDRAYEGLVEKLNAIGASIERA